MEEATAFVTAEGFVWSSMAVQDLVVMLGGGLVQSAPLASFAPSKDRGDVLQDTWQCLDLWLKAGWLGKER